MKKNSCDDTAKKTTEKDKFYMVFLTHLIFYRGRCRFFFVITNETDTRTHTNEETRVRDIFKFALMSFGNWTSINGGFANAKEFLFYNFNFTDVQTAQQKTRRRRPIKIKRPKLTLDITYFFPSAQKFELECS